MTRLSFDALGCMPEAVKRPGYRPADHDEGIVHLGCGAFFRAHQAVYTDAAIARHGGHWRIAAVSLRSTDIADALNAQNGLYTLIESGLGEPSVRIVASVSRVIAASREPGELIAALTDPKVRVVTVTVTEKAYGIDRAAQDIDPDHSAVAHDLAHPQSPVGVLGLIVEALRLRFEAGNPPFTVLCCDNLPHNGALLRSGVLGFSRRIDPSLAERIAADVAFPSSMVDRITPAADGGTLQRARELTGVDDAAPIETEPFTQWVIEDRFPQGRPRWEVGGAIFVSDVAPYESMKLRMLNGAHSMLAYAGFLAGHRYVRDVMADPALAKLVERHLKAAAATVGELENIDLTAYAAELTMRFANPAIAHETYQIAMDGTEKLPQRIAAPLLDAMASGQRLRPFAFAIAAWMRYCLGHTETGDAYALRDPREAAIRAAVAKAGNEPKALVRELFSLPGVFPDAVHAKTAFTRCVLDILETVVSSGIRAAIDAEVALIAASEADKEEDR